jgi:hypothetical protein
MQNNDDNESRTLGISPDERALLSPPSRRWTRFRIFFFASKSLIKRPPGRLKRIVFVQSSSWTITEMDLTLSPKMGVGSFGAEEIESDSDPTKNRCSLLNSLFLPSFSFLSEKIVFLRRWKFLSLMNFELKKSFFLSLACLALMEKHWVLIELFALSTAEAEIDDEGIERDSEEIDDEKFVDTKELDHVLEVSCL